MVHYVTCHFYEITAHTYGGETTFRANYLEHKLAKMIFDGLWKCEDVHDARMIDGTTGELLYDYNQDDDDEFKF